MSGFSDKKAQSQNGRLYIKRFCIDEDEAISGRRRLHTAKRAGMQSVPAFVYELSRDETAALPVDSSLRWEHIPAKSHPSASMNRKVSTPGM